MHASNPSRVTLIATLGAMAALGCGAASVGDSGTPGNQTVIVTVSPTTATLATSQSTQFAAAVSGTADTAVVWSVEGTDGGSITTDGTYRAPAAGGTFRVRATSRADASVSGSATVIVTAPPAGTVTISPKTTTVLAGGTVTFTATLTNLAGGVTYGIQETSGCGSVTSGGVYTAPATARTCHVVAMSTADSTKTDVATVTVNVPVGITLSAATGAVDACKSLTFTATVTGSTNTGVTWSITEGTSGGTISNGVYTAPSNAGTYHVVATAAADGTKRATATVTVTERIVSVAVNPTSATVAAGGTQQFSATVTTTCGTFVAVGP